MNNKTPVSQIIKQRLVDAGKQYFANDNISEFISDEEMELLVDEVTQQMSGVLSSLVLDTDNDHNTNDSARRVAKMFIKEIFCGRYEKKPKVTAFPNASKYEGLYVSGPITVRSTCAHHMMPIVGKAYIGIFPGENVIGLSKFNRLTDWICSRLQIQEEMTSQIAEEILQATQAAGVGVLVQAEHFCMTHRGVREHDSDMTTCVVLGLMRDDKSLKAEFLSLVARMK